jgi:hypothetical protein
MAFQEKTNKMKREQQDLIGKYFIGLPKITLGILLKYEQIFLPYAPTMFIT